MPDLDFTVLLVGIVALHRVAVHENVAQSGIAFSVVKDDKIFNYFVFFM